MTIKTINLTGAEVAVIGLDGAHAHIRNDGTDTIYAAKTAGITAGADGVASIPAGQSDTIRGISGTVYLLGTGSVLIQSDDYVASPFKTSAQAGGSGADEVARAAISAHAGNTEIHVTVEEKAAWNAINYSNPNLLINPNFSVNQRGQDAYSAATYTVDHWYKNYAGTVSVLDDKISLSNNTVLRQALEDYTHLVGQNMTLSIKVNGVVCSSSFVYPDGTDAFLFFKNSEIVVSRFFSTVDWLVITALTDNVALEWAKLEVGTVSTPFTPPDPATELAKCQRFYQKLGYGQWRGYGHNLTASSMVAVIPLVVAPRDTPKLTINGSSPTFYSRGAANLSGIALADSNPIAVTPQGLILTLSATDVVAGAYIISHENIGYAPLEINAEI